MTTPNEQAGTGELVLDKRDVRKEAVLTFDPFDFVEPCEMDCTPERHAYHQGQWDMAGRINAHFGYSNWPGAFDEAATKLTNGGA